jgi:hypothetical protein
VPVLVSASFQWVPVLVSVSFQWVPVFSRCQFSGASVSESQIDLKVFKLLIAYNHIIFLKQGNIEGYTHKPTVVDL